MILVLVSLDDGLTVGMVSSARGKASMKEMFSVDLLLSSGELGVEDILEDTWKHVTWAVSTTMFVRSSPVTRRRRICSAWKSRDIFFSIMRKVWENFRVDNRFRGLWVDQSCPLSWALHIWTKDIKNCLNLWLVTEAIYFTSDSFNNSLPGECRQDEFIEVIAWPHLSKIWPKKQTEQLKKFPQHDATYSRAETILRKAMGHRAHRSLAL
jgi:hypothetical protein